MEKNPIDGMAKLWWEHRHYQLRDGRWGATVHLFEDKDSTLEVTRLLPANDRYFATEDEAKAYNEAMVNTWIKDK